MTARTWKFLLVLVACISLLAHPASADVDPGEVSIYNPHRLTLYFEIRGKRNGNLHWAGSNVPARKRRWFSKQRMIIRVTSIDEDTGERYIKTYELTGGNRYYFDQDEVTGEWVIYRRP